MDADSAAVADAVFTKLGTGWWTVLMFVGTALSTMTQGLHLIGGQFFAPPQSFVCADHINDNLASINGTECFLEWEAANDTEFVTVPCQRFSYDNSKYDYTLTTQFDLVCSRSWLQPFYQIIFTLGLMVGSMMAIVLPDKFGRQRCLWYCVLGVLVTTILQVTVPDITVVFISRFLLGIFSMVSMTSSFTLGMEVSPPSLRTTYGVFAALPFAVMMIVMSGVAYYVRNWKHVLLICSIPVFLQALLVNPMVMPESPRWLIARGRLREAEQVLRRAVKLNKSEQLLETEIPDLVKQIYEHQSLSSSGGESSVLKRMKSLFASGTMRKLTGLLAFIWFTSNMLYICVPLGANNVRSPYLYMALLGAAEIPAYTLTAPITARFGRRVVISTCLVVVGLVMSVSIPLIILGINYEWLQLLLAVVPYILICTCFQLNVMFTAELFPTSVRTMGTAVCCIFSNVGLNVPPIFNEFLPASLPWLPTAIYSFLAFVTSVVVLMLPETNNTPMLQTVSEYIMAREQGKKSKCKRTVKTRNQLDDKTTNVVKVAVITGRDLELNTHAHHNEGFEQIT